MDTILVVCGAGASSTFLASRIRTLAKDRGLALTARAASTFDLDSLLPSVQVMLVGPHLATSFAELETAAAVHSVSAALLPGDAFEPAGAAAALDLALTLLHSAPTTEGSTHG